MIKHLQHKVGEVYDSALTYTAAAANAGIGAWLGENWFLVLSAIAVVVRIYIDVSKYLAFKRDRRKATDR